MPKPYVYIAAPYSQGDIIQNIRTVILAAERLAMADFVPFIPHTTAIWHLVHPHEIQFWYDYDLAWLEKCDCLVRLPGESFGADNEVEVALLHGKPVYFSIDDCIQNRKYYGNDG